mgnify:FL=1
MQQKPQTRSDLWHQYKHGETLGTKGADNGIIIRDEEYLEAARVQLETQNPTAPFAIVCWIYGQLVHTVYMKSQADADKLFEEVKTELEKIVALLPRADTYEVIKPEVYRAIESFVARF